MSTIEIWVNGNLVIRGARDITASLVAKYIGREGYVVNDFTDIGIIAIYSRDYEPRGGGGKV